MNLVNINYMAVFIAGVVSQVVGYLWYSPWFLGKPWMRYMGYNSEALKKMQKQMGPLYGISFLGSLATALVLAHVMALSSNAYALNRQLLGLSSGFWMWFGFIAPVQMTEVIFGGKKWQLFVLNTGYQLVAILAMGLVIGWL